MRGALLYIHMPLTDSAWEQHGKLTHGQLLTMIVLISTPFSSLSWRDGAQDLVHCTSCAWIRYEGLHLICIVQLAIGQQC